MAQTPPCSSAVPLHRFPPVGDLTDAIFACIPPRQRKNFAVARLLEAGGVLEAMSDAHGRHDVPVALQTTSNGGAYHVDGLAACWGRLPIGTVRHCAIYCVETSRSRAIAAARMLMNTTLADKTHVGAEYGDETAQNAPDDGRLDRVRVRDA